jgi:sugar phosphate permease
MGVGRFYFGRAKKIPRYATAVSLISMAATMVCLGFLNNIIAMLGIFALSGLACACVWPGIINAAVTLNRNASGQIMSYLNLGAGIGGAVLPFANGAIMNFTNATVSFMSLAAFPALAGIYMWKNAPKESAPS